MRRLLALTLLALAAGAAPAHAVIGGTPVPAGSGRFVVALVDAEAGARTVAAGQYCAATVVRRDVLVTAAHCLLDADGFPMDAGQLRVHVGLALPLRRGTLVRVRQVTINPSFDDGAGAFDGDVGVIRLRTPLPGVTPIALAGPRDLAASSPGAPLDLWGWGNRATEGQNPPRALQTGRVQRFADGRCDELYGRLFNPASQLCAAGPGGAVDACDGDSGGPLTAVGASGRPVLTGIVSYGQGCGRPQFPTVYTKVARFRAFVARELRR